MELPVSWSEHVDVPRHLWNLREVLAHSVQQLTDLRLIVETPGRLGDGARGKTEQQGSESDAHHRAEESGVPKKRRPGVHVCRALYFFTAHSPERASGGRFAS